MGNGKAVDVAEKGSGERTIGRQEIRETTVGVCYVREVYIQKLKIRSTLQCQKMSLDYNLKEGKIHNDS